MGVLQELARVGRYTVGLILGVIFAIGPLADLAVRCCRGKRPFRTSHERPFPSELADPLWGSQRHVVANGINFSVVERNPSQSADVPPAGSTPRPVEVVSTGADADAPLMLCLHGFPECGYSWRHIAYAFSSKYRVVAPDMRGFGRTPRAEPSWWAAADYKIETLVEDVRQLILAHGKTTCTLVAHDWGGIVAWAFAYAHPEMVDRLVIMNAPHPLVFEDCISFAQILKSFYVFAFQLPVLPEMWLRSNNFAFIRNAFLGPTNDMGVHRRDHPLCVDERDVAVYQWSLSRAGGTTAGVNYYRNIFTDNPDFMARIGVKRGKPSGIFSKPTLVIWGENDGALGAEMAPATEKYVKPGLFAVDVIPRASHWVQQDAVEEVVHAMASFLGMAVPGQAGLRKGITPAAVMEAAGGAAGGALSAAPAVAPAVSGTVHDIRRLFGYKTVPAASTSASSSSSSSSGSSAAAAAPAHAGDADAADGSPAARRRSTTSKRPVT